MVPSGMSTSPRFSPDRLARDGDLVTGLGACVVADCLEVLRQVPDESLDLVITSPPYDRQGKYRDGERYPREWYEGTFLEVTGEILRALRPRGSFVLNYRSKRQGSERGTLQYELVFWLREQGLKLLMVKVVVGSERVFVVACPG
jgi:DNA modification methylase